MFVFKTTICYEFNQSSFANSFSFAVQPVAQSARGATPATPHLDRGQEVPGHPLCSPLLRTNEASAVSAARDVRGWGRLLGRCSGPRGHVAQRFKLSFCSARCMKLLHQGNQRGDPPSPCKHPRCFPSCQTLGFCSLMDGVMNPLS